MTTSLVGASLNEADLTGTLLSGVNLTRTNLSGACFAETFIADCQTLRDALGLASAADDDVPVTAGAPVELRVDGHAGRWLRVLAPGEESFL